MGDNNALVRGVDKRVRALVGDFESFPIYFESRDDISIMLLTPYMSYRTALIERGVAPSAVEIQRRLG